MKLGHYWFLLVWAALIFIGVKYVYFSQENISTSQNVSTTALAQSHQNQRSANCSLQIHKYYVKKGECLWNIARKFDVSVNAIAWANELQDLRIHPHQELLIPNQDGILYKVKRSDTLVGIVNKFGVGEDDIFKVDQLENVDTASYVFLSNVKIKHKLLQSLHKTKKKHKSHISLAKANKKHKKIKYNKTLKKKEIKKNKEEEYCDVDFMWPAEGKITSKYGWRWGVFHKGIDIGAPLNTPVYASGAGEVIYVGTIGKYGKTIKLSHDNGIITTYAHLKDFNVCVGDRVEKGKIIGYVGASGNARGPHLHFEVSHHNKHKNPLKYIK